MGVEAATRPQGGAEEDVRAWAGLATAQAASDFCAYWLTIQCLSIPGTVAGLVLTEETPQNFSRIAVWPNDVDDLSALTGAAQRALRDGRSVVIRSSSGEAQIAHPIKARGRMWCAVAITLTTGSEADFGRAVRALHWGSGWLEALSHRRSLELGAQAIDQQNEIIELIRIAATNEGVTATALAVTNLLATRLHCRRAALGINNSGQIKVLALSHSAILDRRSKTATVVASAMEEALDQAATVTYPPLPPHTRRISVAHRNLARSGDFSAVISVVMIWENRPIGVVTLAREEAEAFDDATVEFCERLADVLGPIMELQSTIDRPLSGRIPAAVSEYQRKLIAPRSHTTRLLTLLVLALAGFLTLVNSDYRVTGKATLEGIVQQAAVAPFDGFVIAAPHRAGDVVSAGAVLATLDTRELNLEALRYESQRDEAQLREQEATAKDDRATAAVEAAEARAAEAQRKLAADKIARATITAPFAGLVVSGDLSQSLGSPVERGKVLFEIAPLDSYRVSLAIDERDIGHIASGQRGQLVLTGFATEPLGFTLKNIISVATPANGSNTFRVEASLDRADSRLRPGMEGVGKIEAGRRSLGWIWSHGFFDWLRLVAWKWLP